MPKKCLDCDEVTLPNDDTRLSAIKCEHCGSEKLTCDHPSGHYVPDKGCFVCSTCGFEYQNGLKQLRKLAERNINLSQLANFLNK
ncbi:hypothetical protein [Photobacterium phosphoreum]|uniref:hypothetical protein n=1 Tax=Photobacterium phosphoreum TaxID=659 RepID=UPI0024B83F35|nr:hypothetical protein [Photobacterium phosphoreum]